MDSPGRVRLLAVVQEACKSAISQPVVSAVTVIMIVGMVLTVMLTTGRTVGAEQQVLATIDTAGTRAIQVRAQTDAGLTADVLDRIADIEGIEWAAAFSGAIDGTNTAVPGGARVPVRLAYGRHLERLGVPHESALPGQLAYASSTALTQLGLPDRAGSITTTSSADYAVAGEIATPDFLKEFEPLVLVPQPHATGAEPVNVLVVIASRPDLVSAVSDAIFSVLAVDDPTKVTVQTSENLVQLRALVQTQLGTFSRGLVLITLAITGVLVTVILYSLVMMRRKDFGRRRALGATRGLIMALLLLQTAILAAAGVVIGLIASVVVLVATGDPMPGGEFVGSLVVLTLATALFAAVVPAYLAGTREPIRELRVP